MYAVDVLWAVTALTRCLTACPVRSPRYMGEVFRLTREAQRLRTTIPQEHVRFFYPDLERDLDDLSSLFQDGEDGAGPVRA